MKISKIIVFPICFLILFSFNCGKSKMDHLREAFKDFSGNYVLYINKKDFTLNVVDRSLKDIALYDIAYGLNPDKKGKLYEGDNRTPEGHYKIVEILSMDADRSSTSYRKLKKMNEVLFRASHGHSKFGKPNVDLGDNVYGPRFLLINYPNETDKKRYTEALERGVVPIKKGKPANIGYGIAIHGLNDIPSIRHLASSGCIRMYNNDIVELDQYIIINTPVIITAE